VIAELDFTGPEPRPTPNEVYKTAQRLVKAGQPVFPCKSTGAKAKAPLTQNGFEDATLDRMRLRRWWQRHRDAAIGIPTGIIYDVLDVDIKDNADGRVHLPYLNRLGLLNGCKKVVKTPSGGWHLYFLASPGLTNKARGASIGLDVRGKGGYVLAAGSYIETPDYAGLYVDMGETTGSTNDPLHWEHIVWALAPFGVDKDTKQPVNLLPSDRQSSIAALREWVTTLQAGERNNGLFWAISRCIESGIDPHELVEPATLTGLDEEEILFSINAALTRAGLKAEEMMSEVELLFPDNLPEDL
jgi:hypothetical protein